MHIHTGIVPLAPAPDTGPNCMRCGKPSDEFVTETSNRNNNEGRPYFKCVPCNKFLVFNDTRGNDPDNPACSCGVSSKRQAAGHYRQVPRGVHYVCRLGRCNFYVPQMGNTGRQVSLEDVEEELLQLLVRFCVI
ncbi:unnamed protein product [Penicillium salamii]|uniref:GRF-like zinc ribbon domain-containing protein n=1 Tax=Penicillium salamii TaxID=1612424 RepID=A0A9W4NZK6_9EURO|nr:unnamed protein product [Penicillium salamii]CAG7977561.1 unnamed protein product [Penicillium salamii]CAG8085707.1 unnamed protein product [Penicillium salamii]CAG8092345.1 unnamed protein product [Penicillium salamii]CAG8150992.1 unnamed protein product [Penicillium salamii]